MERTPYPSDVSDDAWALVAPYVPLIMEEAPQRTHRLREVGNGLHWLVRAGAAWRLMPHDLPPWDTVSQQSQRWLKAGVFAAMGHDLRAVLPGAPGRHAQPAAAICDSRPRPSPPESGTRTGYDGATRRRGSPGHRTGEPLGHVLAVQITAATAPDRRQGSILAEKVHEVTGDSGEHASVDPGYTGAQAAQDAQAHPMQLEVVKLPAAKPGFVWLPKRWIVECSNAWAARFRRWARDYAQWAAPLKGWHVVAFAILMLQRVVELIV